MTVVRYDRPSNAPVGLITLDRPAKRNSLVWETWVELDRVLTEVEGSDVRAVVISGAGDYFSSGGDRESSPAHGNRALAPGARIERAQRIISRIRELPVPVIAAVEGGAVGLGWSLVLACDAVFAAENAVFRAPFLQLGLVPDGGATWVLLNRLGRQRAAQILWLGARTTATECLSLGIVTEVTTQGHALEAAQAFAEIVASYDPHAVELSRRLMLDAERMAFDDYLRMELLVATQIQATRAATVAVPTQA